MREMGGKVAGIKWQPATLQLLIFSCRLLPPKQRHNASAQTQNEQYWRKDKPAQDGSQESQDEENGRFQTGF
jgi:hypothetical protein